MLYRSKSDITLRVSFGNWGLGGDNNIFTFLVSVTMLCLHVHVVSFFFIYIIFNHASSVFLQVMFYVFIIFLVYSPASKRNLAVRNQIQNSVADPEFLKIGGQIFQNTPLILKI
jgi:c-di-AMP phosphodiesterase-like protein